MKRKGTAIFQAPVILMIFLFFQAAWSVPGYCAGSRQVDAGNAAADPTGKIAIPGSGHRIVADPEAGKIDASGDGFGPLRLGYATLTPLHCALGEILDRTGIVERYGFTKGKFQRFPHGKDQDIACRQGLIDATFTCEVPAMIHLYRLPGLVIIGSPGSLGDIALVVPAGSPVKKVGDLAGSGIAVHGGSSARLMLGKWLAESGVKDFSRLEITLHGGDGTSAVREILSGGADAAILWDPWLAKAELENDLRILAVAPFWSLCAVYEPNHAIRETGKYMEMMAEALAWGADHLDETAGWVSEISGIDKKAVKKVLLKNRFLRGGSTPDLTIDDRIRYRLNACESFAVRTGMVSGDFRLERRIKS